MTQLFDELIHADDADADRRRVERRGASIGTSSLSAAWRKYSGSAASRRGVRGWRTKLDGIGAPRASEITLVGSRASGTPRRMVADRGDDRHDAGRRASSATSTGTSGWRGAAERVTR